jgi:DNA-binding FadR family transcriptional regulator
MTMTTFRSFIAFLILAGTAGVTHAAEDQSPLIPLYEKVAAALVADDLTAVRAAVQKLATEAVGLHHAGIASSAQAVARADDLAGAREAFKTLSVEVVALAKHTKGYFILTCSMAQADWVQSTRAVANPYLGKDMLTCGEVKEETKG